MRDDCMLCLLFHVLRFRCLKGMRTLLEVLCLLNPVYDYELENVVWSLIVGAVNLKCVLFNRLLTSKFIFKKDLEWQNNG